MRKQIFVFGSNRQGRHGKGSALEARKNHGAIYGVPYGLQGNSYAIVTKELRSGYAPVELEEVRKGVSRFLVFAANHPDWDFNVVAIGCSLTAFNPQQIAPMFNGCTSNVNLPEEFRGLL